MNKFVKKITHSTSNKTVTTNGMRAKISSKSDLVDFFYKVGASRGQALTILFDKAIEEDHDLAVRILLWARDIRGGAGEREVFRIILKHLGRTLPHLAIRIVNKVSDLGRWDDMLVFDAGSYCEKYAFGKISEALIYHKNPLCAKWMPRKGPIANRFRAFMKLTPRQYRKLLVYLTNVVESKMCARDWNSINFNHVPSIASVRYKSAFYKNAEEAYSEYIAGLEKGTSKVNASAVYPYQVLKDCHTGFEDATDAAKVKLAIAQWDALPNYVGEGMNILPVVDVSASMLCPISTKSYSSTTCLDVAVSLGLYLATKNKGAFNDVFCEFSFNSKLHVLKGDNIIEKMENLNRANWMQSTNLEAALKNVLNYALTHNVPKEDMPSIIVIFSDMQFNRCVSGYNIPALKMIKNNYESSGYEVPKIVFWNLNSYDNIPVSFGKEGVALVSGFSPAIMKSLFSGNLDYFTPYNVMLDAVNIDRYSF